MYIGQEVIGAGGVIEDCMITVVHDGFGMRYVDILGSGISGGRAGVFSGRPSNTTGFNISNSQQAIKNTGGEGGRGG